jgi:hypothetical protein
MVLFHIPKHLDVSCKLHLHPTLHSTFISEKLVPFCIIGLKFKIQVTHIWFQSMNLGSHIKHYWVYTHIALSTLMLYTLLLWT